VNKQYTMMFPPVTISPQNTKGVDGRAATSDAPIAGIRNDEKLAVGRQHA